MATDSSSSSLYMQGSSYDDDPIANARLIKHQNTAVACLILKEFDKLDPTTGDASCQVRAVIVLVFHQTLRMQLSDTWDDAVRLSRNYMEAHENDKPETKAKTIDQIQGADHCKSFDDLVETVRLELGEQDFELLGLTYSLCISGVAGTDEFEIDFRHRSNNLWGSHEKALKTRLAQLACDKFVSLAKALPSGARYVDALQQTRSIIEKDGLDDMPVLSIQATFFTALAILYVWNIPIVNSIVRVQIDSDETTDNYTYKFGSARSLLYFPNKQTGRFELEKEPTAEQKSHPAFYIKAWSTYNKSSTDVGLYSSNHTFYYRALSKINIDWAVMVYTACHPPFTRRARDANMDIASVYSIIDGPPSTSDIKNSRFDLKGLNHHHLDASPSSPQTPKFNLSTVHHLATKVSLQHGLDGECQLVRMGAPSTSCTYRITRPVDWQIAHASASTTSWVDTRLKNMEERHKMADKAVIGRYVFSLGSVGASCESKEVGDELHNVKTESTRRKRYLGMYPGNEGLLRR